MKSPIVVDEHGSVLFFKSVKDAEKYLEPIDVRNNEYIAYDSEGRLLQLIATTPQITIKDGELRPLHAEALHQLLIQFFLRLGISEDHLKLASLQELVTRGLEYH
jgi:hypothetical protein